MKHLYLILLFFSAISFSQVQLLKNIALGIPSSTPGENIIGTDNIIVIPGVELNGYYYFSLNRFDDYTTGYSLWRTDGTGANTNQIKTYGTSNNGSVFNSLLVDQNITLNDHFYFKEGPLGGNNTSKIWRSDGTETGTEIVVNESNSSESEMLILNNNIIYTDFTRTYGRELYIIPNGLPQATPQLLKDIRLGNNGNPNNPIGFSSDARDLNLLGNSIIFIADDNITDEELWITDGTEDGTQLLKDINPSGNSFPTAFIKFNNKLYFFANDGSSYGFWVTDGTTNGTQLIKSDLRSNEDYLGIVYNNKMYFGAKQQNTGTTGLELWSSDGTTAGTQLLKNINPDIDPFNVNNESGNPNSFTIANNLLFFIAETTIEAIELWVTDGTESNTVPLTNFENIRPFSNAVIFGEISKELFSDGNTLYFSADATANNVDSVRKLFSSMGTIETTGLFADINPNGDSFFLHPFIINNKLVFQTREDVYGSELWTTNLSTLANANFEIEDSKFKLYPNPSLDFITITDQNNEISQISIFSMDGRNIKTITSQFETIAITNLKQGTYLVQLKLKDGNHKTLKFIKN